MTFNLKKGATLLIPTGPAVGQKHLYVVLTEADQNGMHLLANFSSVEEGVFNDPSCEVEAGCHKFIKHKSYVVYEAMMERHKTQIVHNVEKGVYIPQQPASDDLVKAVCGGFDKSKFCPKWAKKFYAGAARRESKKK